MSRFVFWDGGLGGAAEAAVATAVTLALRHPQRLLLVNEGPAGSGLEEGMRQTVRLHGDTYGGEAIPEHGLDALLRLQASGRLAISNFADYTVPLLRGRLDLVCGTRLGESTWKEADRGSVAEVLAMAEQAYDGLVLGSLCAGPAIKRGVAESARRRRVGGGAAAPAWPIGRAVCGNDLVPWRSEDKSDLRYLALRFPVPLGAEQFEAPPSFRAADDRHTAPHRIFRRLERPKYLGVFSQISALAETGWRPRVSSQRIPRIGE